ncbi:FAD-dependent oxidoreductase [Nocardia inohanensis]|uniref:FAD-dependent oxidoreductase n=1 Tax=Nocardia inohanensis TaxID=209246 RepID=UPI0008333A1D|nr:FAD-dependent oxidoreductase [Nocardia inohanensis]
MAGQPRIEIREWGRPVRHMVLDGPVLFGRDRGGEVLADDGVSRQHLRLVPSPTALSAVDLGSRNGTTVNGVALNGRRVLATGDVLRLGRSEIIVLHTPTEDSNDYAGAATNLMAEPGAVPPPPPAETARPAALAWTERLLGIDSSGRRNLFPVFTELPSRVPLKFWQVVRAFSMAVYLALIIALLVAPAGGLFVMFQVIVPLLPGLFLIAPGLWRNVCPLAATNQLPRLLGFTRAATAPRWIRERGYLLAVALFFGIAGSRLAGLDRSGAATAAVLALVASAAFAGGVAFKGKSGWCSTICPLFPLQRAYGRTPFVTVANNHCQPCVGCSQHCYDFKPRAAYLADLTDSDRGWSAPRKLFAAALPGFVLGFLTVTGHSELSIVQRYAILGVGVLAAVGVYFALESLTAVSPALLTAVYSAAALDIFYWFAGSILAGAFATITGVQAPWLHWLISAAVFVATLIWLARTQVAALQYAQHTGTRTAPVLLPFPRQRSTLRTRTNAPASVLFEPGPTRIDVDLGMSLLDIAERGSLPLEAGCRMGVCGADPVAVLGGADNLCEPTADERNTLRRLGFADNTRMACCARVTGGDVEVALTPQPGSGNTITPSHFDRSLVSVVVVGNGIAGVTAADFIRRGHPDCEIHLVGRESHDFYNRMGISRLVYGRSAMQGLHLLPEHWYEEHRVTPWLNTLATAVDIRARRVRLGTGDVLPYDRLILAMGAGAALPAIDGLRRPGSFVLREAGDALRIRAYAQQRGCTRAVVAGGGLLGLEAAFALHQLGLRVTVLERGERLLSKQLDPRCSAIVLGHFVRRGIEIRHRAETTRLTGDPAVRAAVLRDGTTVPCELFLTATGIKPDIDLARRAGLAVGRGILVDDRMRTSAPDVYAAGDVAEHRDRVLGLWPIAAEQAQAAAVNALGGDRSLTAETPATILKGVGLELFTIGRPEPGPRDRVIVIDRAAEASYRRLILSGEYVVGATVLGHHPADVAAAQQAVRTRRRISPWSLAALHAGDWSVLTGENLTAALVPPDR